MPDVYATARGPLARLASPLAARARARRHERFFALTRLGPGARVLDVGCGQLGLRALEPGARHHRRRPARAPRLPRAVRACRRRRGPAVRRRRVRPRLLLERDRARRRRSAASAFAAEMRRVGRGWFVQTPAFSFPIEPHSLLPGRALAAARACAGATGASAPPATGRRSRCCAAASWKRCSDRRGPSASPASPRAGSASAGEPADVVADAVDHEEQQQHDPHRAVAVHRHQRDRGGRAPSRRPPKRCGRRRAAGTGRG